MEQIRKKTFEKRGFRVQRRIVSSSRQKETARSTAAAEYMKVQEPDIYHSFIWPVNNARGMTRIAAVRRANTQTGI